MMGVETTVCVVLLCGLFVWTLADTHSLSYLYTIQSKSSSDRGYEFSVVTLLDDEQIDSYSSTDGVRSPKQDWLKKMKESVWEAGTDKLKYDELWLNHILDMQMKALSHRESDGHTLQWRIYCEGEERSTGSLSVLNCINEYGYDGEDLISYSWTLKKWTASVSLAKEMEEEWNHTPGYQTCGDCEHWLKTYLQYSTTETNQFPPGVHVFVNKPETNSNKMNLTCLVTGFYPKDVVVSLRKFTTSLPEHLLTSSGVRPNEDGTYQVRKSVKVLEDHTADYDCYVTHSSLNRPVIERWGRPASLRVLAWTMGITGVVVLVLLVLNEVYIYYRRKAEPRKLRVVETTPTSVEVQWEKPQGKIDRYILSVSPSQSDGPVINQHIEVSSGEDSAVIDDLEPGSVYILSLVAVKGETCSHPVTVEAATGISEPRNLRVVKTTPTSVEVQWERPLEEIDRYVLSLSASQTDGPDKRWQIKVSPGEDSAVIDGLKPGSEYIISLVAVKTSEQSQPATVQAATSSRSNGSPHDSEENIDETSPMIQRTTSDPDRLAHNPPEERWKKLWSSAAALLQDR